MRLSARWVVSAGRCPDTRLIMAGLPYWHWSKYLGTDPNSWPMFDGSDTSLSGNGTQTGPQCACVMEGPFADWVVTLGPLPNTWGCTPNPQSDGFGKNPRCIERTFDLTMLDTLGYDSFVYTATAPGNTCPRFSLPDSTALTCETRRQHVRPCPRIGPTLSSQLPSPLRRRR